MFFLFLLPKPYLTPSSHPIKSQPIWKNLAEQKRLWDLIHQTQVHMERVVRRVQADIEALQTKLDHVHTWNTTSSASECFLNSLNGSVEQKIKDTVRKSFLDSVLVEFRDGKIILSPRLVFLLQDERIMNEI
ncbi:hypothetical protein INT47_001387 [Mucor saturninus]|uniref:Uncharacterized protein n=1 Tax=Mucor saturninus TaxID=64648 RepID=A0A8H7UW52_9FUNG|nr:hypothetical protein INT47_001387 [Mucor saturninus]